MEELDEEALLKEISKRGTAEVIDGRVYQVTQSLIEEEDKARFLVCGQLMEEDIVSIEDTCAVCSDWKKRFESIEACQLTQKQGAEARGFRQLICPHQFKSEYDKLVGGKE